MTSYADYHLLLPPPQSINEQIDRYKRASARIIGDYPSRTSPAHISVAQLQRRKAYVFEPEMNRTERLFNSMPPVILHIQGFDHFRHGASRRTIYARIRPSEATEKWFRLLYKYLNLKPEKDFRPHITIARNIGVDEFNRLWPYFEKDNYTEPFRIDEMVISKRDTLFETDWQSFKRIQFQNRLSV